MPRKILVPLAIVAAGVGLALLIVATGPKLEYLPPPSDAPLVETRVASPQSVQLSSVTHGTVQARTESELIPEVSGRVIAVGRALVSGGFFDEGDLLLEIDPLDYELALEQARAALASAESELANARKAHERQLNLAEKQSTSEAQRDDALNRLQLAEARLREARAGIARAERDLARTKIRAPFQGRVRSERVDIGQFVTRGTPVASLYATDIAEVRLPLQDEELAYLRLPLNRAGGDSSTLPRAILRARFAGREHEWESTIVRTEGELDPQTRMVNVIARVEAPYETSGDRPPLAIGLFVEAEILGREVSDVYILPRSALQAGGQIYIVDGDNRLIFRDVDILRVIDEQVYIQGGLRAGERVCLSTIDHAVEGMTVRPAGNGEAVSP